MNNQHKLSLEEIAELASVIVRDEGSEPRYSADDTALALIRLAAGLAAYVPNEDDANELVLYVALGCFHRTHAHGKAVDDFEEKALRFDIKQLPDSGHAVVEFWRRGRDK